jgi:formate hydrogenlyase subunit 3/multisubunit Na+/H+ antiporter MnhD subunit
MLLSNSVTLRRDKSILYSRVTITILITAIFISYDNLYFLFLNKGIGIFSGLFHSTAITAVFQIFILTISSVILMLTAFYPRKVWLKQFSSMDRLLFTKLIYYQTILLNKMGEQFKIIEYSLIILFIVIGSLFLLSTSDLVSIFLSIELQSYGLYLLSTIYRDSEPATFGGLMYFLLGGLSSCFILLSTSLLYANSGTTNLDSLYIITSISNVSGDNVSGLLYWYKAYYIHTSLLFMSIGFLFKVSAAPFHFWSPDVYDAIPTVVTTFVAIISKISIFIFLLELVHYTSKSFFDMNFSWTMSLLFSSLLSLIIGTVVGLTQSRIKRLYAFSTISHVGFILLGLIYLNIAIRCLILKLIALIYPFITLRSPSVHSFVYLPIYSSPSNIKDVEPLMAKKKECKEELMEAHEALKTLKGAIDLDKVLPDKSQNHTMKQIQSHYSAFFDEESGNSKQEGLKQLYTELLEDFNIKKNEYDKAKKNLNEFKPNSEALITVIVTFNYNFIFSLLRIILPFITMFISAISLVISISTIFPGINIDIYIPDIVFYIRNYIESIVKYEIFISLPTLMWSFYSILNKIKRYINMGKTITPIILSSYLGLSIFVITLVISLFIFIPESFINTVNLLSIILFNL